MNLIALEDQNRRTSWILRRAIIPLLFGGAVLDAIVRIGYRPPAVILWCAVASGMIAWRYVFPLEKPTRKVFSESVFLATGLSVILVLGDLIRLDGQAGGLNSIFASRVLYHEDNSSWIALGTSSSVNGVPSGKFGHQLSLLLALGRTAASVGGWFTGIDPGSWGVSVAAVTVSFVGLLGVVPFLIIPIFRLVQTHTQSKGISTLVASFFLFSLIGFVREVRNLGHLSAGIAVVLIVAAVNLLITKNPMELRSSDFQAEALLIFGVVLNVWFPLQPLSFIFSVMAIIVMWKARHHGSTRDARFWLKLLVLPAPMIIIFLLRYVKGAFFSESGAAVYKRLLSAPGATYETYDALLILLALFVGLAFFGAGQRMKFALGVGVSFLLYGISVRFADAAASLGFDYGSTKLLWVLIPPLMLLFFGVFMSESTHFPLRRRRSMVTGTILVSFVILLTSTTFFHSVRSFHPFLPISDEVLFLEHESEEIANQNEWREGSMLRKWDQVGGLAVELSPHELPTSCVAIDGLIPTPQWGFEPYRCTRKLAEASLVEAIQRESDGQPVDILLRRFPLLQASLTETIVGLVESGNDLSRQLLILDQNGGVVRTERILDYIVQVTSYRDLTIKFSSSESDSKGLGETDSLPGSVDHVDLEIGTISGWVDPAVTSLSFLGSGSAEDSSIQRTEREDVAQLQGAGSRYSGFSFTSPKINQALRCVVAHSSNEEHRVLWSAEEGSC